MEVSQISRTLARSLGLNEDLCETLSLAHDLGHTPFGHAGEEVLNNCMKKFGGFDHNIQTLRILTLLENKYYNFPGLNLSIETLDGLVKHNGPVLDTSKYHLILGKNIFKKKINFLRNPSLESQISSISDDIAYNSHDLEDGLNSALFKIDDIKNISVTGNMNPKKVISLGAGDNRNGFPSNSHPRTTYYTVTPTITLSIPKYGVTRKYVNNTLPTGGGRYWTWDLLRKWNKTQNYHWINLRPSFSYHFSTYTGKKNITFARFYFDARNNMYHYFYCSDRICLREVAC